MSAALARVRTRLEAELELPYPERALFLDELEADLLAVYQDLRARGLGEDAAAAAAVAALELAPEDRAALLSLHRPAVRRFLDRLPAPARDQLEAGTSTLAFAGVTLTLATEAPVMTLIREGGLPTLVVLAIGLLGLLLLAHRLFRWFVLRDHSAESLRLNTSTPLVLAAATLGAGVMGAAIDYYVVLMVWSQGLIDAEALRVGLREPLSPLIFGAALATLTLLLHAATQAGLRRLRVEPTLTAAG